LSTQKLFKLHHFFKIEIIDKHGLKPRPLLED